MRPEDLIGQILGHFRIVRLIGYGGIATVFLAQDINLRRDVAIKVFSPRPGETADFLRRFTREAQVLAQLDHPNILPIFEYGEQNGLAYLVMPYMAKGSLQDLLKEHKALPILQVIHLATQILNALQYAYERGLIHRDIKPGNILLKADGTLLLSDFGLVKVLSADGDKNPPIVATTQTGQIIAGTPDYMAPEQATGQATPSSDIYSVGVVLYEMLAGFRPFRADTALGVVVKHIYEQPPSIGQFNHWVSPQLEAVVLRALGKDPTKRYQRPVDFLQALEQATTSERSASQVNRPGSINSVTWSPPSVQTPSGASIASRSMDTSDPEAAIGTYVRTPGSMDTSDPEAAIGTYVRTPQPINTTSIPPPPPLPPTILPRDARAFAPPGQFVPAPPALQRRRTSPLIVAMLLFIIAALLISLFAFPQGRSLLGLSASQTSTTPGTNSMPKAPPNQQIFILPESGVSDIATFDPGLSTDLPSIQAIDLVFTGLVQLNDQLQVVDQLAASHELMPDGVTWKFTLRPNLKFSDGTPLTSADVAYSIDRALQPAEKSTVGPIYLALIKDSDKLVAGKIKTIIGDSLLTPDPNTIVIVASKKAAYFLDALTYSCSYVIEKSLIDKYGAKFADHLTEGGGDGPFKVAEYTHGQRIVFVPNPNYYGPIPQLQKVVYPFYKDSNTVYSAYQAGQVDEVTVPSGDVAAARQLTNEYHQVPQLWINYYTMNYLVKPFDNIHIRQAFDLAANKEVIQHAVWKDSVIASNHIVPQGMPGYNSNLTGPDGVKGTSGDPGMAKTLFQQGLQEERWSSVSQVPPIILTYSSGSQNADNEVAALQQMWQSVLGVSVKANPIDFNKLLTEITAATNNPKGLQFWGIAWIADYPDPQDWTTLQFDKGAPNNNMNYGQNNSSAAVQQQLEAADAMVPGDARLQQYMNAEQQLVNDVAWLPMEQVTNIYLLKPYVQGMLFNAEDLVSPNDWGSIYISTH